MQRLNKVLNGWGPKTWRRVGFDVMPISRSLSASPKQPPLGKIRLHTMRHDLAKSQVMAQSMIPIPPKISFYLVFRQAPRAIERLFLLCYLK